jgi:hypothetical protein
MGLASAIEEYRYKYDKVCAVAILYEKLPKEDKVAFDNAVKEGIATTTICVALRKEGYKLGEPTLNLHRRGNCKCIAQK